jgi:hypothetical protein
MHGQTDPDTLDSAYNVATNYVTHSFSYCITNGVANSRPHTLTVTQPHSITHDQPFTIAFC